MALAVFEKWATMADGGCRLEDCGRLILQRLSAQELQCEGCGVSSRHSVWERFCFVAWLGPCLQHSESCNQGSAVNCSDMHVCKHHNLCLQIRLLLSELRRCMHCSSYLSSRVGCLHCIASYMQQYKRQPCVEPLSLMSSISRTSGTAVLRHESYLYPHAIVLLMSGQMCFLEEAIFVPLLISATSNCMQF